MLLLLGLLAADGVIQAAKAGPQLVPARCIIGAGSRNGTFRFQRQRGGESWLVDNPDEYRVEMHEHIEAARREADQILAGRVPRPVGCDALGAIGS